MSNKKEAPERLKAPLFSHHKKEKLGCKTIKHLADAIHSAIVAVNSFSFNIAKVRDTLRNRRARNTSQLCKFGWCDSWALCVLAKNLSYTAKLRHSVFSIIKSHC